MIQFSAKIGEIIGYIKKDEPIEFNFNQRFSYAIIFNDDKDVIKYKEEIDFLKSSKCNFNAKFTGQMSMIPGWGYFEISEEQLKNDIRDFKLNKVLN